MDQILFVEHLFTVNASRFVSLEERALQVRLAAFTCTDETLNAADVNQVDTPIPAFSWMFR